MVQATERGWEKLEKVGKRWKQWAESESWRFVSDGKKVDLVAKKLVEVGESSTNLAVENIMLEKKLESWKVGKLEKLENVGKCWKKFEMLEKCLKMLEKLSISRGRILINKRRRGKLEGTRSVVKNFEKA